MSTATHHDNKRVAKNTVYLYLRTMLVMVISIFTSRIILDALGVNDYGIYNAVGGFVAMFTMLSGTLVAASQRFIAFELGKQAPDIRKVFSTTVSVHILLAAVILILFETVGLWFLNCRMNIAPERMTAANWVYQCSVLTFCINLICIPYNAAIIAYEKMSAFAYISIFEVMAKLLCVYALFVIALDSLILYAVFMMSVAIVLCVIYSIYCIRHFPECRYSCILDRQTFNEMLTFSGWNFIGSIATNLNGHGINILTNLFFGVALNAARGVAAQIDNAINTFVNNFLMAITPQITKSYAAKDYGYINRINIAGTKYSFFLLWMISLPVCINAEYILGIWLKEVPEHTAVFVRLGITFSMCQTLSQCLYRTMLASGNIKKYQIVVGGLSILAFPAAYIFFYIGLPASWGYWAMIIFSVVCLFARLRLLHEILPDFSTKRFCTEALLPVVCSVIPVVLIVSYIHTLTRHVTLLTFIGESLECVALTSVSVWILGLTRTEREKCVSFIQNKINRLRHG